MHLDELPGRLRAPTHRFLPYLFGRLGEVLGDFAGVSLLVALPHGSLAGFLGLDEFALDFVVLLPPRGYIHLGLPRLSLSGVSRFHRLPA